jgi:putative transposase
VIRAKQAGAVDHDSEHHNPERAPRTLENAALTARIKVIHTMSAAICGAPKIHTELRDTEAADYDPRWASVSTNRAARLTRSFGIRGASQRRSFVAITERIKKDRLALDLVKREPMADAPNKRWIADIT